MSAQLHRQRADRVAELYLAGRSPSEIAADVGCTEWYVHKIRRRRGIPAQHPRLLDRPDVRQDIVQRYRAGEQVEQISTQTGVPRTTVYKALRQAGVPLRPSTPKGVLDARAPTLIEQYASGLSLEAIAAQHGCSAGGVRNTLLRHGVILRSCSPKTIEFTPEEQSRIIEMRDAGARVKDISGEFGRHPSVVTRFLESAGRGGRAHLPRVIGAGGYVFVRDADRKLISEHRHVMSLALGRVLGQHETVHHINGDITDNRLENLQLRQGKHGKGVVMTCSSCGSHNIQAVEIAS